MCLFSRKSGLFRLFRAFKNNKISVGSLYSAFPILIKALHIYSVRAYHYRKRQLPYDVQGIFIPLDGSQWKIFLAQVDEAILKTKYLAQGHKHVGTSGARTHDLAFQSPALWLDHTRLGVIFKILYSINYVPKKSCSGCKIGCFGVFFHKLVNLD